MKIVAITSILISLASSLRTEHQLITSAFAEHDPEGCHENKCWGYCESMYAWCYFDQSCTADSQCTEKMKCHSSCGW